MLIFLILLAIIFWVLFGPVVKALWRARALHREWMRATAGMRGGPRRQNQPPNPAPKKKKIDPEVGEYVAFEEIACDTTVVEETRADGSRAVVAEQQVEDAIWEEIK